MDSILDIYDLFDRSWLYLLGNQIRVARGKQNIFLYQKKSGDIEMSEASNGKVNHLRKLANSYCSCASPISALGSKADHPPCAPLNSNRKHPKLGYNATLIGFVVAMSTYSDQSGRSWIPIDVSKVTVSSVSFFIV